jgi:hypothetical protein
MKYIFKKYEFETQELAETRIAALPHQEDEEGNEHPSHNHTVVKLGHPIVEQGTYDEEGNELTAPVLAVNYSVDVLWRASEITVETQAEVLDENGEIVTPAETEIQFPYGWASKEITLEEGDNGVHTFAGWSFNG